MSKDAINDVAFNWWRGRKRLQCSNREDEKVLHRRSRRERDCFNRREKLDNALQLNCQKELCQRTELYVIIYRFYTMLSILFLHSVQWVQPVRQILYGATVFAWDVTYLPRCFMFCGWIGKLLLFTTLLFRVEKVGLAIYLINPFTWRVSGTPSSPPSVKWNVSLCLNLLSSVARGSWGARDPPFVSHVLSKQPTTRGKNDMKIWWET